MNFDRVKTTLKKEEGFIGHAYRDHLGYLTIGYGRMIDHRRGGHITEDEADFLLKKDIARIMAVIPVQLPFYTSLPGPVQDALVLMAFQMGVDGLMTFRRMLDALAKKEWSVAAKEALNSHWAEQTPARARRVAALIKSTGD